MAAITVEGTVQRRKVATWPATWLSAIARLLSIEHYYRGDLVASFGDLPAEVREEAALRWHARQQKVV